MSIMRHACLPHLLCPSLDSGNRRGNVRDWHGKVLDRGWRLRRNDVDLDHGGGVGRYQQVSAAEGMGALHLCDRGDLCVAWCVVYGNVSHVPVFFVLQDIGRWRLSCILVLKYGVGISKGKGTTNKRLERFKNGTKTLLAPLT